MIAAPGVGIKVSSMSRLARVLSVPTARAGYRVGLPVATALRVYFVWFRAFFLGALGEVG